MSSNLLSSLCALFLVILVAACTSSATARVYPSQKNVPVIGMLVSPLQECMTPPPHIKAQNPIGCIESYYPRWLEQSAARVVPVPWNASKAHLDYLFPRVNGFLFPGGGLGGKTFFRYIETLGEIVNRTLAANAKGDKVFIWGTCFGFQMMAAAIARRLGVVTGDFNGMYPLMMSLNFTKYQKDSRMLGDATTPPEILRWLQTRRTTLNWHHAGITPDDWAGNQYLTSILRPLSTNTEPSGKKSFISSYEGVTANIFASQFHPERPEFEFTSPLIGHTTEDVAVSQYLSEFAISRAKLNEHKFENPEDSEKIVVERYPLHYREYGMESWFIIGDPGSKSGLKEHF